MEVAGSLPRGGRGAWWSFSANVWDPQLMVNVNISVTARLTSSETQAGWKSHLCPSLHWASFLVNSAFLAQGDFWALSQAWNRTDLKCLGINRWLTCLFVVPHWNVSVGQWVNTKLSCAWICLFFFFCILICHPLYDWQHHRPHWAFIYHNFRKMKVLNLPLPKWIFF